MRDRVTTRTVGASMLIRAQRIYEVPAGGLAFIESTGGRGGHFPSTEGATGVPSVAPGQEPLPDCNS